MSDTLKALRDSPATGKAKAKFILATDGQFRVIYDNGTESNLLRLSLQRALYKDETGRRLTGVDFGPLFADQDDVQTMQNYTDQSNGLDEGLTDDDIASGTIYVLRSQSDHPFVVEHREVTHKIGVTGGRVEIRVASAEKDATYLLADVEIIATYQLHNVFAPTRPDTSSLPI